MIALQLSEEVSFLIFYIVRFFVMAGVIALAIFIGAKLRKLYDTKKAKKAAAAELLASAETEDNTDK